MVGELRGAVMGNAEGMLILGLVWGRFLAMKSDSYGYFSLRCSNR